MLVVDRRLQNCSDRKLRALWVELAKIIVHHGTTELCALEDLPEAYRTRYAAVCEEFARRGVQLHLF